MLYYHSRNRRLRRCCFAFGAVTIAFITSSFLLNHSFAKEIPGSTAAISTEWTKDGDGIEKFSFPTSPSIERADLYAWQPDSPVFEPQAILLLVPGRNGNGRRFLTDSTWRDFARSNRLILFGVSFASDKKFVEESYSNANSGSGNMILGAVDAYSERTAGRSLPLLLYGFSAGARFTASFVENHSDRVLAWCGYSVGRWERAKPTSVHPPGIVASGEWDAGCYHASLLYFQQGRKLGKPWLWLSLKETGHQRSSELDGFVRDFFIDMMGKEEQKRKDGRFFDIDTKKALSEIETQEWPIFATWVPGGELEAAWLELHHP